MLIAYAHTTSWPADDRTSLQATDDKKSLQGLLALTGGAGSNAHHPVMIVVGGKGATHGRRAVRMRGAAIRHLKPATKQLPGISCVTRTPPLMEYLHEEVSPPS